jgi:hypothetical protein
MLLRESAHVSSPAPFNAQQRISPKAKGQNAKAIPGLALTGLISSLIQPRRSMPKEFSLNVAP